VSGESTRSATANVAAFERAFGARARCNRCEASVADYRVLAVFLHDTVAVRAYCPACYEQAIEGEYHARGDGMTLDYAGFSERFGAAGPPPPPCTPVDRMLRTLLHDSSLRFLAPPSEALARRSRTTPYQFRISFELGGAPRSGELSVMPDGGIQAIGGDPLARAHLTEALR
jgi:hypothetical protein